MAHIPVLLQEVLEALSPKPGDFVIDGTLGSGGHANELIKRIAPNGTFLGTDRDPQSIENFKPVSSSVRVLVRNSSYAQLPQLLAEHNLPKADALLLDLGFSSEQLSGGSFKGRGFSFQADEPLIMTYDDHTQPLRDQLISLSEDELTRILREFGEERDASRIAQAMYERIQAGRMQTTGDLVAAVERVVKGRGRIHPATRTFQALRIWANQELEQLETLLKELHQIVKPGGRVAIISFHSLEDRIVKNYFRDYARPREGRSMDQTGEPSNSFSAPTAQIITKKPITASQQEISANPRSRSAKLRVLQF